MYGQPAHLGVKRTTDEKFIGAHEHVLAGCVAQLTGVFSLQVFSEFSSQSSPSRCSPPPCTQAGVSSQGHGARRARVQRHLRRRRLARPSDLLRTNVDLFSYSPANTQPEPFLPPRIPPLRAAGLHWRLDIYPHGYCSGSHNCLSVAVELASRVEGDVKAQYEVALLDQARSLSVPMLSAHRPNAWPSAPVSPARSAHVLFQMTTGKRYPVVAPPHPHCPPPLQSGSGRHVVVCSDLDAPDAPRVRHGRLMRSRSFLTGRAFASLLPSSPSYSSLFSIAAAASATHHRDTLWSRTSPVLARVRAWPAPLKKRCNLHHSAAGMISSPVPTSDGATPSSSERRSRLCAPGSPPGRRRVRPTSADLPGLGTSIRLPIGCAALPTFPRSDRSRVRHSTFMDSSK